MSAKDIFHRNVKVAIQKEGWLITHDPYPLQAGSLELYIDLGMQKVIAAEKEAQKIAVEIKSFLNPSKISDFYSALGQFIVYRTALAEQDLDRTLYLAIPMNTYDSFFQMRFIGSVIQQNQVNLLVYDPKLEVIKQWEM